MIPDESILTRLLVADIGTTPCKLLPDINGTIEEVKLKK